jgi:methionyl-tRNA formyltransferase
MGTPDFAARALIELIGSGHEIAAVYTRAPQPSGRGQKLTPSPVQKVAEQSGIPVRTPLSFKKAETVEALAALEADAAIVVAYGLILPQAAIDATRLGAFNLHASLLPRWRGAAPIQRAIMAGDAMTGVQVMRMERGLDTGPILLSETTPILPSDTAASLHDRLAEIGANLLPRFLAALDRGQIVETPQKTDGVLYAEKITPDEARIDWTRPAREVDQHIRGLSPFPGAWFEAGGERVKALMSRPGAGSGAPGAVLAAADVLRIACGDGAVDLTRLQRAGRAPQTAAEFLRGFKPDQFQRSSGL